MGLTGLALAAAVGGAGYRVLVIERAPLAQLVSAPYDGRVTAVARGAGSFLTEIGAWDGMAAAAEPILDIVVREGFSPIQVHYDHRAVGAEPLGPHRREPGRSARPCCERVEALPTRDAGGTGRGGRARAAGDPRRGPALRRPASPAPLLALCEGRQSRTRERLGIGVRGNGATARPGSSAPSATRGRTAGSRWSASSRTGRSRACR